MLQHLQKYDIILGSASPRRKELFATLNMPFSVITADVEEIVPKEIKSEQTAEYLAQLKADVFHLSENQLLITADTIVVFQDTIYGKPKDRDDAIQMLQTLNGNTHKVITGVCIKSKKKQKVFSSTTKVKFRKLSLKEIEYYVDNHKPYDKAGAYGIQEWIGHIGVKKIVGSYFNVMGLPTDKIYKKLQKW